MRQARGLIVRASSLGVLPLGALRLGALLVALALGVIAPASAQQEAAPESESLGLPPRLDPSIVLGKLAKERLGRPVAFKDVTASMNPPSLHFGMLRIGSSEPGQLDLFQAWNATTPIDVRSLLGGVLVIDSLTAETAMLRLPIGPIIALNNLRIRAVATSPNAPIEFDARAEIRGGGQLRAVGTADTEGVIDATLHLTQIDISPFADALPRVPRLEGIANGTIRAQGPGREPDVLRVDLVLGDAVVDLREVAVTGQVGIEADLENIVPAPAPRAARFRIDGRGAHMKYGDGLYEKPPGTPAIVEGRIRKDRKGGLSIPRLSLKVGPGAEDP